MARKNKKETLGNYVCKIWYINIYQKFILDKNKKVTESSYRLVHAKHVISEKINTFPKAKALAKQMVIDNIKYEKHSKS